MQKTSIEPMLLPTQQQLYDYTLQYRLNRALTIDPYTLYAFQQQYHSRLYEQSKPSYSYIGLIAMAILSSPDRQLVLSDIYQWILDSYPYFRTRGFGWRNSIRHNLSLNDCFVKGSRSTNGKGHYWRIHPANLVDFMNGDFRRRRAQRQARKSMGLSVSGDEDEDDTEDIFPNKQIESNSSLPNNNTIINCSNRISMNLLPQISPSSKATPRKRCFDVDSLLAPDQPSVNRRKKHPIGSNEDTDTSTDIDISV